MDAWWLAVVTFAGCAAGFMNAVVGAGTLVTFPALLAAGLPPVVANATNCLGLVSGSVGGLWPYRLVLAGVGHRLLALLVATVAFGAAAGGALVLVLPPTVFAGVVPVLIAIGCALMFVPSRAPVGGGDRGRGLLVTGMLGSGVYGGFFGAAQGVILLGVLRVLHSTDPVRINGIKNLLGLVANATASVVFIAYADIAWPAVLAVSTGSVIGGLVGGRFGQRLSANALRAAVVAVSVCAIWSLLR